MIIKVCGLNNADNLTKLTQLPFEWVGYNFYAPSPRFLSSDDEVFCHTTQKRVGVFVNASFEEIETTINKYCLDLVQLHGDEDAAFCNEVVQFTDVIKVFRIDEEFNFSILDKFSMCTFYLFDTASPKYGGTGHSFDWSLLKDVSIPRPFLLSGGITPLDVDKIAKFQHPNFVGIDINSRFETEPGIKDVSVISTFITTIRSTIKNSIS